jgi:hypothetical protein
MHRAIIRQRGLTVEEFIARLLAVLNRVDRQALLTTGRFCGYVTSKACDKSFETGHLA